jgi:hypothetical protein
LGVPVNKKSPFVPEQTGELFVTDGVKRVAGITFINVVAVVVHPQELVTVRV